MDLQEKYENINKKATDIILAAKSTCLPIFPAKRKWSLDLKQAGLQLRY